MDYSAYAISTSLLVLVGFLVVRFRSSKLPYPPGPKGLPLIGNLRDLPTSQEWITFAKWSKEFDSDVIHLNVAGAHFMVVNTQEAAYELFDKRSAIYSDRPRFVMITELMGWDWSFSFLKYGPKWRSYRRLFHQYFHVNVVHAFYPQTLKATHELLQRLLDSPEKFTNHLHLMTSSLALNIAYGIDLQSFEDPYIEIADKTMAALAEVGTPGAFLVDTFPWLKYVPEWVPGAGFQKKAKIWKHYASAVAEYPLKVVKDEIAKGTNTPSIASHCIETYRAATEKQTHEAIRAITAVIYVAGSDTTVSAMLSFFLAIVLNPKIFRKAQQEIDEVVGRDRLPDFSDKPSLPYICAVGLEALRWNPVTPLGGTPHATTEDDVYNGYFIPKGAVVVGNTWALLHDEKDYPDPNTFNPERFLKDGEIDPDVRSPEAAFGFGRRMCPGRHLANDMIFIVIATVVAMFDISKSVGPDGKPITPSGEYSCGLLSHPQAFECAIKPRSQQSVDLIKEAYTMHHP